MRGRSPKAVHVRSKPESGAEARCSKCWAEARCSRGKNPKVGPKPDAVNAGPKPDAGQKPKSWAEAPMQLARLACRAGWVAGMDSASDHSASRYGEVKTAGGLPAKVGTTRLSCGRISLWRSEDRGWSTREGWHDSPVVRGGWPGWTRLLITAHLAMEK
ncbi:hypothetical protein CRG98_041823 [Punica granatum]|uniref:Uncharacterized protein n=1 Tax=Punica granatum TaxID=22663 RepID=A0A2I0I1D0_PUNGR|nr:hypothetical protein CRG98_041823 [Punica granatum]